MTIKPAADNQNVLTGFYPSLKFDIAANCRSAGNGIPIMCMALHERKRNNQRLAPIGQGPIRSLTALNSVTESYHEIPEKVAWE
jgi:hypothetical protein